MYLFFYVFWSNLHVIRQWRHSYSMKLINPMLTWYKWWMHVRILNAYLTWPISMATATHLHQMFQWIDANNLPRSHISIYMVAFYKLEMTFHVSCITALALKAYFYVVTHALIGVLLIWRRFSNYVQSLLWWNATLIVVVDFFQAGSSKMTIIANHHPWAWSNSWLWSKKDMDQIKWHQHWYDMDTHYKYSPWAVMIDFVECKPSGEILMIGSKDLHFVCYHLTISTSKDILWQHF